MDERIRKTEVSGKSNPLSDTKISALLASLLNLCIIDAPSPPFLSQASNILFSSSLYTASPSMFF
ncbi:MAG: hypothetical protein MUF77_02055, partial [Leptospira sp.]|nr:hypothetical protein [Leptospira sp.]